MPLYHCLLYEKNDLTFLGEVARHGAVYFSNGIDQVLKEYGLRMSDVHIFSERLDDQLPSSENPTCPYCHQKDNVHVYPEREESWQCDSCGMLFFHIEREELPPCPNCGLDDRVKVYDEKLDMFECKGCKLAFFRDQVKESRTMVHGKVSAP